MRIPTARACGLVLGCLFMGGALSPPALAQSVAEENDRYLYVDRTVSALGEDLFGEQVNLYTGELAFMQVDADLPGNNALPVRIVRSLTIGAAVPDAAFGTWQLALPHLRGSYAKKVGWLVDGPNTTARCSNPTTLAPPPALALQAVDVFDADEFWSGVSLSLPDGGSQLVLRRAPGNTNIPTGGPYPLVTHDGWAFSCLPSIANGAGEGFLARAPDGTRYRFDWMVTRSDGGLGKPAWDNANEGESLDEEPPNQIVNAVLLRVSVGLLPTRIEDRFGNWVQYTYDPQRPDHLLSISASDGRALTLTYEPNSSRIATVSDGTRTWTYSYTQNALTQVLRPDNSAWTFALGTLPVANILYQDGTGGCDSDMAPSNLAATWSGSITHPSGAKGTFTVGVQRHGLAQVPKGCRATADTTYPVIPRFFDTLTLRKKDVIGPGVPLQTWSYEFGPPNGSWAPCDGCPTTKTVDVIDPAGDRTHYTFDNRKPTHGRLLETAFGVNGNTALRRETLSYAPAEGQPWPSSLGDYDLARGDPLHTTQLRPINKRVITQDGATFTWMATAFDSRARPTQITRSSSLGPSRSETTTYHDNTALWVLSQTAKLTIGNVVASEIVYDSKALPHTAKQFGALRSTSTYRSDGTLQTVTDGNGHITTLDDWYRGIPRSLTWPDGTTRKASVNDFGWITQTTDETGASTTYTHDSLGRITSVVYPDGDNPAWQKTTQAFERINSVEFGLAAGHWRQTVSTGTARRITYFDAYWRPRITREYDTANDAATTRYWRFTYDHAGRPTFASYPGATDNLVTGTWTDYDALGRTLSQSQDSELGVLLTTTQYLSGFTTKVTNPRGFSTTTTYQAFDTPAYDAPLSIDAPASTTTTITRDTFGKPTALVRSGPWNNAALSQTRSYIYDAQQRLCKTIEPETGATVLDYDGAGNIAWSATGQSLTGQTCDRASVPQSQRATHSYDSRDRITSIDYPSTAADLGYTYDLDGALKTASASAVGANPASTWTYTYNKRRLLTGESLSFDGTVSSITHGFDANASIASLTYPSGLGINYAPNALGQPTQAGTWATAVTYHRNGATAGFTYGNGAVRTVTQTTRQWPDRIRDQRNGTTLFDHDLDYDETGNVEQVTDGLPGSLESRTLTYDGRDRLVAVNNAPTGNETYAYDPLDHLRQAKFNGLDRRYTYNAKNQLDRIATQDDEFLAGYTWNNRGALASRSHPGEPGPHDLFRDGFEQGGDVLPPKAQTFIFDAANRLRSITGIATYTYDAHGHRLRTDRADGTRRTSLYTRSGQLLEDTDTQTNQRVDYISLNGNLVAKRTRPINGNTATITYLHTDHRGTPAVDSSAAGQTTLRTRLSPYGIPYDNQWRNGPGLTGHVTDADTQLSYMQQRYMDQGIFISPDPVAASADSFDRYLYASNNPYRFSDPDGRAIQALWGAPVGFVVDIAAQKIANYDKPLDWNSVWVSTAVGAATGGIGSIARTAAIRGTITVGEAIAGTAVAAGAVGAGGSAAESALNGESPNVSKMALAGAVSAGLSVTAGLASATSVLAAKMSQAAVNTPQGIGVHVAKTTAETTGASVASGLQGAAAAAGNRTTSFLAESAVVAGQKKAEDEIE